MLSNILFTSSMWLFNFKLIKIKFKNQFLSHTNTFQVLGNHLWVVDRADTGEFRLAQSSLGWQWHRNKEKWLDAKGSV